MKRFILRVILLTFLFFMVPLNVTWGQDLAVFGGARFDDGFHVSFGICKQITSGLWGLSYVNAGEPYVDLNTEVAYLFRPFEKLSIGPLIGGDVEWQNEPGDGIDPVTYILGATGALGTYDIGRGGFWAYYKYRFTTEPNANLYEDGYAVGGGGYWWLDL